MSAVCKSAMCLFLWSLLCTVLRCAQPAHPTTTSDRRFLADEVNVVAGGCTSGSNREVATHSPGHSTTVSEDRTPLLPDVEMPPPSIGGDHLNDRPSLPPFETQTTLRFARYSMFFLCTLHHLKRIHLLHLAHLVKSTQFLD
jgi:hypothetical protein